METKKLTAKDLMIGNYAKLSKGNWSEIRQLELIDIEMIAEGVYFAEAIPLTAEILEKNGFYFGYTSQQEDAASQIGCSCEKAWTYDEGGGSIQVTFPNECDGGLIVLDDQDFDKNLEFVFANQIYVHELQQALRLFGVDKEITL